MTQDAMYRGDVLPNLDYGSIYRVEIESTKSALIVRVAGDPVGHVYHSMQDLIRAWYFMGRR